jgi:hypothetical protein
LEIAPEPDQELVIVPTAVGDPVSVAETGLELESAIGQE